MIIIIYSKISKASHTTMSGNGLGQINSQANRTVNVTAAELGAKFQSKGEVRMSEPFNIHLNVYRSTDFYQQRWEST